MLRNVRRLCVALVLAGLFLPLWAGETCTQADLKERLYPAFQYRLRCLDGVGRLNVFRVAATPHSEQLSAGRLGQVAEGELMAVICREVEALIAIADDVLAGGDGLTDVKRVPWQGVTPDDVLAGRNEVMRLCGGKLACYREVMADYEKEMASLDGRVRMGQLSAVAYIEAMHALFGRALESMKEKQR